jgi:prepilin signal peptidase PulO-like enzyme (type II secretory pathway)
VFYIIFRLLAKIKIKSKQAMGEGDAPLAGFIGLWLGWPLGLVALYAAFIIGAVVGGGMILLRKKKGNEPIPFGPFLILGTFIAYWGGLSIINLIIR